ncbi:MAG: TIR domain-containing protein [Proteobacteria bacterium]|nr:TIR domain-containing protein [Pseudomonadota bacterium]
MTIKVFISYSWDCPAHKRTVLQFSEKLREHGIDCFIDQYINGSPAETWTRWMEKQIEVADFVLVVCTQTYLKRFKGEDTEAGRGVNFEGLIITQTLYDHFHRDNKFIPVIPDDGNIDHVPLVLKGKSIYSFGGQFETIWRVLANQPKVSPKPLGALTFSQTNIKSLNKLTPYPQQTPDDEEPATEPNPQFIGRQEWLARFETYRTQPRGVIWRITGQPGIGKSSLLQRFQEICRQKKHPVTWLNMEGFIAGNGVDVLEMLAKQLNMATATAQNEIDLLTLLAAAGNKHPVCLVDTFEHLMRDAIQVNSQLTFKLGQAHEENSKTQTMAGWLVQVFKHLQSQGWRVVMAGRELSGSTPEDVQLPRFTTAEILLAAKQRPALQVHCTTQAQDLGKILASLSFQGNPLWLQLALNLLENELAEGKTLGDLAAQPDYLQQRFETEDPFDLGAYEGIEQGRYKLALLDTLTRHIVGLEDQAWKIALPRILDDGIVQQLFTAEFAHRLLKNFNLAGVFKRNGKQYTLHEEIRDLLLAYARHHGWLETDATRALHDSLWHYLNDRQLKKYPHELSVQVCRAGLNSPENIKALEKQLATHHPLNWMLEASYHRVLSRAELPEPSITPTQFWQNLAGSISLSALEKWIVAEHLPDLPAIIVSELVKVFSEELATWNKLFGVATALALREAQLAGNPDATQDIAFWEQRLRESGLADDYFGFQQILGEFYADSHAERRIEIIDQLLQLYGESNQPEVQKQCAQALYNKGVTLGNKLNNPQGEVDAYTELLQRYGDSELPEMQEQCANALYNKGVTLDVKLNDPQGAVDAYTELLQRHGDSKRPEIQEQCAKALYNKGVTLANKLNNPQAAVDCYNELLQRYGDSKRPEIQERCAKALVNKGTTLGRLDELPAAIVSFETLLANYQHSENPAIQAQCLLALGNLAETLLVTGRRDEAIVRLRQVLASVNNHQQEFAIMPFLLWLAGADITTGEVVAAIRGLSPEVQFTWGFSEIRPMLKQLTPQRQTEAASFIAFFEDHHDLSQLPNSAPS